MEFVINLTEIQLYIFGSIAYIVIGAIVFNVAYYILYTPLPEGTEAIGKNAYGCYNVNDEVLFFSSIISILWIISLPFLLLVGILYYACRLISWPSRALCKRKK